MENSVFFGFVMWQDWSLDWRLHKQSSLKIEESTLVMSCCIFEGKSKRLGQVVRCLWPDIPWCKTPFTAHCAIIGLKSTVACHNIWQLHPLNLQMNPPTINPAPTQMLNQLSKFSYLPPNLTNAWTADSHQPLTRAQYAWRELALRWDLAE